MLYIINYIYLELICQSYFAAEALESINIRENENVSGTPAGVVYTGQRVDILEMMESAWMKNVWPGSVDGYAFTGNVKGKYYRYV